MWTLGLDPATYGAAVLLSPTQRPLVGWCWASRTRATKKVWEVAIVQPPFFRVETHATLHALACCIREGALRVCGEAPFQVACEAPHIALNPQTGIHVAITTGKLIGPLEVHAPITLIQPNAWRAGVLGLPWKTKREDAKAVSLSRLPTLLPGLQAILTQTAILLGAAENQLDHLTDAAGLALHLATQPACPNSKPSSTRGSSGKASPNAASSPPSAKRGSKNSSKPTPQPSLF